MGLAQVGGHSLFEVRSSDDRHRKPPKSYKLCQTSDKYYGKQQLERSI